MGYALSGGYMSDVKKGSDVRVVEEAKKFLLQNPDIRDPNELVAMVKKHLGLDLTPRDAFEIFLSLRPRKK